MDKRIVETEKYYDVLVNDDSELMITIKSREAEPETPVLYYAGGEHALLVRDSRLEVILDYIHPGVRQFLGKAENVLFVELEEGDLAREYVVPVRQEKKLPIPEEELP